MLSFPLIGFKNAEFPEFSLGMLKNFKNKEIVTENIFYNLFVSNPKLANFTKLQNGLHQTREIRIPFFNSQIERFSKFGF